MSRIQYIGEGSIYFTAKKWYECTTISNDRVDIHCDDEGDKHTIYDDYMRDKFTEVVNDDVEPATPKHHQIGDTLYTLEGVKVIKVKVKSIHIFGDTEIHYGLSGAANNFKHDQLYTSSDAILKALNDNIQKLGENDE